jgi:hypothetical protein
MAEKFVAAREREAEALAMFRGVARSACGGRLWRNQALHGVKIDVFCTKIARIFKKSRVFSRFFTPFHYFR